jgi:hypothetical protein
VRWTADSALSHIISTMPEQAPTRLVRRAFDAVLGDSYEIHQREARWLGVGATLVAAKAMDERTWQQLQREAWLLTHWRAAGIPAPQLISNDANERIQVRERLRGLTGAEIESRTFTATSTLRERLEGAALSGWGEQFATSYGELAARIRGAVTLNAAFAAGFPDVHDRKLDVDLALSLLEASSTSAIVRRKAQRVRDWLASAPAIDAVVHGNLRLASLCASGSGCVVGVFDLDEAGLDEAAGELRYAHSLGSRFAGIAASAAKLELGAVVRVHLRCVLAHVVRHGPKSPKRGSIIDWASAAFEVYA